MHPPPPPSLRMVIFEGFGALHQLGRLLLRAPSLLRQPRGKNQPVLVFPGYGTGDATTLPLRGYLRFLGYQPHGWGLGTNKGNLGRTLPKVLDLATALCAKSGQKLHLIGWSLGGVFARELARQRPGSIAQVITLGTPVVGGAKYTTFSAANKRRGIDLDAAEARVAKRNQTPLRVPVTSIYSRWDRVVAWQASIDPWNPHVAHLEVRATHSGLGLSPEVFATIAQCLAKKELTFGS